MCTYLPIAFRTSLILLYWVRYASSYLKLRNHRSIMILSAQQLFTIHALTDQVLFEKVHILIACKLTALIRIQDNRFCYHKRLFNTVMTILVSRLSSTSQPMIQRLYQSITAVKYKNPCLMGMQVMSMDHA